MADALHLVRLRSCSTASFFSLPKTRPLAIDRRPYYLFSCSFFFSPSKFASFCHLPLLSDRLADYRYGKRPGTMVDSADRDADVQ